MKYVFLIQLESSHILFVKLNKMNITNGNLYTIKEISSKDKNYKGVIDSVIRRTKSGNISVEKVYDVKWNKKPFKWSYFNEFKPKRRWFYHGSSDRNIQSILNTGFIPSSAGKLGPGVYATYHPELSCAFRRGGQHVLCCMVYAPKTYLVDKGKSISHNEVITRINKKYDAIEVRSSGSVGVTFSSHEICVFEPTRIIPRFLIKVV